jgi:hypothetical protein
MTSLALSQTGLLLADDPPHLLGLPTERTAKPVLPGSTERILKPIASLLNQIVADVISKRTGQDFEAAFKRVFPQYVELVVAFSRIAATTVEANKLARLSVESFSELEAELREHGVSSFGAPMVERGLFTVWTLRKTSELLELLRVAAPAGTRHKDREFADNFLLHALRARFHVDCLVKSIHSHQALYPDVLSSVEDGLRSAVDAYAWVKQAVDLRSPNDDGEPPFTLPITEDEQELLDSSTHDFTDDRA